MGVQLNEDPSSIAIRRDVIHQHLLRTYIVRSCTHRKRFMDNFKEGRAAAHFLRSSVKLLSPSTVTVRYMTRLLREGRNSVVCSESLHNGGNQASHTLHETSFRISKLVNWRMYGIVSGEISIPLIVSRRSKDDPKGVPLRQKVSSVSVGSRSLPPVAYTTVRSSSLGAIIHPGNRFEIATSDKANSYKSGKCRGDAGVLLRRHKE
jgi:hypothetical protein